MFLQKNVFNNHMMTSPPPPRILQESIFDIKMNYCENVIKIPHIIDVNQLTFILNKIEKNKEKKIVVINNSTNTIPNFVIDKLNSYYEYVVVC